VRPDEPPYPEAPYPESVHPGPAFQQPPNPEPSYQEPSYAGPSYPEAEPAYPEPEPAHWESEGVTERQARAADTPSSDECFTHAVGQPSGPLSDPTRYLCAAAYLNPMFANTVIGELLASHRAVVPSLGIDVVPIIRHCLNARRAQILRDLLLTVFLIAGL